MNTLDMFWLVSAICMIAIIIAVFKQLKRKRLYEYAEDIASQRSILMYLEYYYFRNPQKFLADFDLMWQVEKCRMHIKSIENNYYRGWSFPR